MKKFFKIVLITLVSLFLVICVVGYVVLAHVDLNRYKDVIAAKAQEATGRELTIGEIRVKPSFSPTVELSNVTLSNTSWGKEPLMASIGAVDISVAVIPLLHQHIVIKRFMVSDTVINLEENKEGQTNWVFENTSDSEEKDAVTEDKTSFNFSLIGVAEAAEITEVSDTGNTMLSSFVIKEVDFNNVKINYTDKTAQKQTYDIQSLRLEENEDDNIDFDFKVNDGLYAGKGTIGALALLDTDKAYPVKADLDVMGINIVTDLQLFDVMGDLKFSGDISSKGFMGKGSTYNESAEITVKGDLKEIASQIKSLQMAGNVIRGDINAKIAEKIPEITATLNSDRIDIASFSSQSNKKKSAWNFSLFNEAQATSLAPAEKIPYDVFSMVNLNADLNVATIVNGNKAIMDNVKVSADVKNGMATVKILQGKLAKGNVKADVVLSAKNKTLNANTNITSVNLIELLKALDAQTDTLRFISGGNTDLYIKLKGAGNTYASVVDSLNGQVAVIIDKSELHLGNIGLMKGNILSQLLNTLKITKGNDDLNLACAVVRADINDGLAKFPNGIVVFADKFTVVANGDINLKNDKIGLSIKPFGGKLTDTNIAKALSSLVKLTGTLQEPKIGVDSANALKTIVGVTTTGPMYLGAQMLMENDNSPCYTALKGTGYENRFPKPDNVGKSSAQDVGKVLDDSVGMVKNTTKGLINLLSGKKDKATDAK